MSPALRASDVDRNDRGRPPREIAPPSAVSAPVRIFTSVLLPAPFAPIRAWISPPRTRRSAERNATTGPKFLASPLASSTGRESATGVSLRTAAICGSVGRGHFAHAPSRCRLARTLAGDQVLLGVGRVRLDVKGDAVVRVEAIVEGLRKLGRAVGRRVVPHLRREVNHVFVRVGLLQRGQTHSKAGAADWGRVGHRGPGKALALQGCQLPPYLGV